MGKKFKIAVCISGEPRQYQFAHRSIKKYFQVDGCETDYFLHAWDNTTTPGCNGNPLVHVPEAHISYNHAELYQDLKKVYQPRKLILDPKDKLDTVLNGYPVKVIDYERIKKTNWSALGQWHSAAAAVRQCLQYEKLKDFRYDLVIKTRYDIYYDLTKSFSVPSVMKRLSTRQHSDAILTPRIHMNSGKFFTEFCYTMGSSESMELVWSDILRCTISKYGYGGDSAHHYMTLHIADQGLSIRHMLDSEAHHSQHWKIIRPTITKEPQDIQEVRQHYKEWEERKMALKEV